MSDAPVLIRDNDRSQCNQSETLFCASIIENGESRREVASFTDLKQVSNTFQHVSNKDQHETITHQNDKNETNLIVLENGKMFESSTHNNVKNVTGKTSENAHDKNNLPNEDGADSGTSSLDFTEDDVTGNLHQVNMDHDPVKSLPVADPQKGAFESLSPKEPQTEAFGRSSREDPQKEEDNFRNLSHKDQKKDTFNCVTHDEEFQDIFSQAEISAILETWKPLWKEKKQMATDIFCRLFTSYPEVRPFFKDFKGLSIEEIRNHKKLRGHALSFIYALKSFVDNLDDPETLDGLLRKMAVNHVGRGISGKEIAFVPNVFIEHLEECFPDIVTDIHRAAWKKFFGQIVKTIIEESPTTK